ncbi:hypothetical protein [Luteimonas sp. FCS-9]|uniref:hypothetical protein n=1 Tax=Luteimonas sp. FCS-9 TaxID=1547516 RepID=UPI00069A8C4F|nr:hypothetical protein [Luteimonas sp. FCS-9]
MGVMYGAAWENDNGDAPQDDNGALTLAGEVWREGLVGITGPQLARGLQRCILSHPEWPPRIGQFRALCMDVPTLTELRLELRADATVRSPFARLVWEHLDPYQYRMTDARHADRLLAEAYAVAREHVLRGGALPEPAVAAIEEAAAQPYSAPSADRRAEILQNAQRMAGLLDSALQPAGAAEEGAIVDEPDRKRAAGGPDA